MRLTGFLLDKVGVVTRWVVRIVAVGGSDGSQSMERVYTEYQVRSIYHSGQS